MALTEWNIQILSPLRVHSSWPGWLLALCLCLSPLSLAQKMDLSTHNLLITKLEATLQSVMSNKLERQAVTLRLADLYADRARLKTLQLKGQECENCDSGETDRRLALKYYEQVLSSLKPQQTAEVRLQMAHLFTHLQLTARAIEQLQLIIKGQGSVAGVIIAKAHAALAEIYFSQSNYPLAEKHLSLALRNQDLKERGFLTYRLAWAQLNQGRFEVAASTLISILQSPELLSTSTKDGREFDPAFHLDVARDLAIFMARLDVGDREIGRFLQLTPNKMRKENLYTFAQELERLGKKHASILAWRAYHQEGSSSPIEILETRLRLAQLEWDLGNKRAATAEYSLAAKLMKPWKDGNEMRIRFRNFVITWHKVEKRQPSRELLAVYQIYLNTFKDDASMHFQAAEVAFILKDNRLAANLFSQAATSLAKSASQDKSKADLLETALLRRIEAAEASRNIDERLAAYEQYLSLNPGGKSTPEIRYQKAHALYTKKDFALALPLFLILAQDSKAPDEVGLKAADLALDTLVLQKNDKDLWHWSGVLALKRPSRAREYGRIQRQAANHLAVATLNNKQASTTQIKEEISRLKNQSLSGASDKEKISNLKNQIALAERIRDLAHIEWANHELLKIRSLNATAREQVLSQLVWIAELKLNFSEALRLTKQMQLKPLSPLDKELRLAMLSELAGLDPSPFYRRALKQARGAKAKNQIRATLIGLHKNQWLEIEKQKAYLLATPELFVSLILETHYQQPSTKRLNRYFQDRRLGQTGPGQIWQQNSLLVKLKSTSNRLAGHFLSGQSESLLQRSIKRRIHLLGQMDDLARQAVQQQSFTAQLYALHIVSKEQLRLYEDLLALPAPQRLSPKDQHLYQSQLKNQAQVFWQQAQKAEQKKSEFWSSTSKLKELTSTFAQASPELQNILSLHLEILAEIAPKNMKRDILQALAQRRTPPTNREILEARRKLINDPFSENAIVNLKTLEARRGQQTMVAFLDARLGQMRAEVNP